MTRVFFLSLLSRNFDDRLSSNFHRFVILCICWDTPSEKTGLWQLPKVSRVFNHSNLLTTIIYHSFPKDYSCVCNSVHWPSNHYWQYSAVDKMVSRTQHYENFQHLGCNVFMLRRIRVKWRISLIPGWFGSDHKVNAVKSLSKGRHTIGNCQRPVFSLGVSQHMHKITNLWKFELNWSSELGENDERKNTLVGRICVLSDRNKDF